MPGTGLLPNQFNQDLEKLYEVNPYQEVVHSRIGQGHRSGFKTGTV
jgi:hypothetical protein